MRELSWRVVDNMYILNISLLLWTTEPSKSDMKIETLPTDDGTSSRLEAIRVIDNDLKNTRMKWNKFIFNFN